MKPIAHILSGVIMGGAIWAATKNTDAAIHCGLGNVISDTDHLLEYGAYCLKCKVKPNLREFMSGEYFSAKGTLMVIFHGHEHLLVLMFISIFLKWKEHPSTQSGIAFTIGYGMHMLLDLIGNDCGIKGYSILYRAAVKFDERRICGKRYEEEAFPENML